MVLQKPKFLGIAPYDGLKNLMDAVAARRDDIEFQTFVGDMEQGVDIARANMNDGYDAIISRGGTADLLAQSIPLPVIDIEISAYDILRAIKLAENYSGRYAIVSFPAIIRNVQLLCDLLQYKIDVYTWEKPEDVNPLLETLRQENYNMVLCDMSAATRARQYNLNSILITSGTESIESAISRAIKISKSFTDLRTSHQFLTMLLENHSSEVIVFDLQGDCYFSTLRTLSREQLEPIFRKVINNAQLHQEAFFKREIAPYLVGIHSRHINVENNAYLAFFISFQPLLRSNEKNGIFYYTRDEVVDLFLKHFRGLSPQLLKQTISSDKLGNVSAPIMFFGETGTGKQQVAADIYCKGDLQNHPFVILDFAIINRKTLHYLISNINSPFHENNVTFYLKNLEMLLPAQLAELAALLQDISLCSRNHVYCAYTLQANQSPSKEAMYFSELLSCINITLLPLRKRTAEISTLACLYMATLNLELGKQAIGFEPEALELLMQYTWPQNLLQFRRVIRQIITLSQTSYIPTELVESVLSEEQDGHFEYEVSTIPLLASNKTLSEINAEIAKAVVNQCDGNQSKAAKQLGISRTTLWRMLGK